MGQDEAGGTRQASYTDLEVGCLGALDTLVTPSHEEHLPDTRCHMAHRSASPQGRGAGLIQTFLSALPGLGTLETLVCE
jgi:hypothetical protein